MYRFLKRQNDTNCVQRNRGKCVTSDPVPGSECQDQTHGDRSLNVTCNKKPRCAVFATRDPSPTQNPRERGSRGRGLRVEGKR